MAHKTLDKGKVQKGIKGFLPQGKGIGGKSKAMSAKFPPAIQEILENLPNRSDKIREWVIAGMIREGLLSEDEVE